MLNEQEEETVDKIISAIADYIQLESVQTLPVSASVMAFPGLEIRQYQRRVLQDGKEVNLTRLEYNTLVFLASNPGIVLTQEQIFESVWNMDSDSCHSSVVNVIYNLRKRGCKKSCVYGEVIFPDMSQICRNLLSNIVTFTLSNFFSDNSIADPLYPIHVF